MASTSTPSARPDHADLGLLAAMTDHARVEVADLSRRFGLPPDRVRDRIRRLERAGLIRGYHAVISTDLPAPLTGGRTLVMLRFGGGPCPSPVALGALAGVWRVYTLCSGWDFMVELEGDACVMLGPDAADRCRGVAEVLGTQADFEVMPVQRQYRSPAPSEPEQLSALPPPTRSPSRPCPPHTCPTASAPD